MSGSVDVGAFKRAAARYVTGVTVVSTRAGAHDHAMTVNSFTTVSLEPPLVLFCVERDARFHDAVTETGSFAVSVLAGTHRRIATWLSTQGRPLIGQLATVPHHRGESGNVLIDGAVAHLEAEVSAVHAAGDHSIVVGSVTAVGAPDDPDAALIYARSRYAAYPGPY